jgi:hypothetical protein
VYRLSWLPATVVFAFLLGAIPARSAEKPGGDADQVKPFKIAVEDAVLRDLKERLARTRFPDEIDGSGWDYGVDRKYVKELVAYWREKYDWRAQERQFNQFDQFVTTIDGLKIHFIHQRSKERMLCHS